MKVVFTKKVVGEKTYKNYYIQLENGTLIPIQVKEFTKNQLVANLHQLEAISEEYESK